MKYAKTLKHALGMSILLALSSTSFAELIVNPSPGNAAGAASLSWSSDDANQLLNSDRSLEAAASPQGSTSVTTTLRSTTTTTLTPAPAAPSAIRDTGGYGAQPAVSARAALVMDAQTGEVLFSKNTNASMPIASITKLMTAVVTADARLDMSQEITLESIDFAGAGGKIRVQPCA